MTHYKYFSDPHIYICVHNRLLLRASMLHTHVQLIAVMVRAHFPNLLSERLHRCAEPCKANPTVEEDHSAQERVRSSRLGPSCHNSAGFHAILNNPNSNSNSNATTTSPKPSQANSNFHSSNFCSNSTPTANS